MRIVEIAIMGSGGSKDLRRFPLRKGYNLFSYDTGDAAAAQLTSQLLPLLSRALYPQLDSNRHPPLPLAAGEAAPRVAVIVNPDGVPVSEKTRRVVVDTKSGGSVVSRYLPERKAFQGESKDPAQIAALLQEHYRLPAADAFQVVSGASSILEALIEAPVESDAAPAAVELITDATAAPGSGDADLTPSSLVDSLDGIQETLTGDRGEGASQAGPELELEPTSLSGLGGGPSLEDISPTSHQSSGDYGGGGGERLEGLETTAFVDESAPSMPPPPSSAGGASFAAPDDSAMLNLPSEREPRIKALEGLLAQARSAQAVQDRLDNAQREVYEAESRLKGVKEARSAVEAVEAQLDDLPGDDALPHSLADDAARYGEAQSRQRRDLSRLEAERKKIRARAGNAAPEHFKKNPAFLGGLGVSALIILVGAFLEGDLKAVAMVQWASFGVAALIAWRYFDQLEWFDKARVRLEHLDIRQEKIDRRWEIETAELRGALARLKLQKIEELLSLIERRSETREQLRLAQERLEERRQNPEVRKAEEALDELRQSVTELEAELRGSPGAGLDVFGIESELRRLQSGEEGDTGDLAPPGAAPPPPFAGGAPPSSGDEHGGAPPPPGAPERSGGPMSAEEFEAKFGRLGVGASGASPPSGGLPEPSAPPAPAPAPEKSPEPASTGGLLGGTRRSAPGQKKKATPPGGSGSPFGSLGSMEDLGDDEGGGPSGGAFPAPDGLAGVLAGLSGLLELSEAEACAKLSEWASPWVASMSGGNMQLSWDTPEALVCHVGDEARRFMTLERGARWLVLTALRLAAAAAAVQRHGRLPVVVDLPPDEAWQMTGERLLGEAFAQLGDSVQILQVSTRAGFAAHAKQHHAL